MLKYVCGVINQSYKTSKQTNKQNESKSVWPGYTILSSSNVVINDYNKRVFF